jgi:type I restriction enzyme, R subunit
MPRMTENAIEDLCIQRLQARGYGYAYGPDISLDGDTPRRASFSGVLLLDDLRAAIQRLEELGYIANVWLQTIVSGSIINVKD